MKTFREWLRESELNEGADELKIFKKNFTKELKSKYNLKAEAATNANLDHFPDSDEGYLPQKKFTKFDSFVFIPLIGKKDEIDNVYLEAAKAKFEANDIVKFIKELDVDDVIDEIKVVNIFRPYWPNGYTVTSSARKTHFVPHMIFIKYKK